MDQNDFPKLKLLAGDKPAFQATMASLLDQSRRQTRTTGIDQRLAVPVTVQANVHGNVGAAILLAAIPGAHKISLDMSNCRLEAWSPERTAMVRD
jgi:hypothetical protein